MKRFPLFAASLYIASLTDVSADTSDYLDGFCAGNDYTVDQCTCTKDTFASEVLTLGLSEGEAAMTALFLGQIGLDVMAFANAMQNMDRSHMPAAMQALGAIQGPIYQTCTEVDANTFTATEGKTAARYLQACMFTSGQGAEEKALCSCQVDVMSGQFDDDTFLLITEVTEVEASGEAGSMEPLEYVLKVKRGLSDDAAHELLMSQQGTFMNVPMMLLSCAKEVYGVEMDLGAMMQGVAPGLTGASQASEGN